MTAYRLTEDSEQTEHVKRALGKRIDVYKKRTKFGAWLESYIAGVQALEGTLWEIILERLIDNAVGVQLNTLGKIVGVARFTTDDDEYRILIKAQIAINNSQGLWSDLYQVGRLLLIDADGNPADFHFEERDYATLMMFLDEPISTDPNRVVQYINRARAAGVRFQMLYMDLGETLESSFAFADSNGFTTIGAGLDDANDPGTEGGSLASVVVP